MHFHRAFFDRSLFFNNNCCGRNDGSVGGRPDFVQKKGDFEALERFSDSSLTRTAATQHLDSPIRTARREAWLTSPRAQALIDCYRIVGEQLFTFNAKPR